MGTLILCSFVYSNNYSNDLICKIIQWCSIESCSPMEKREHISTLESVMAEMFPRQWCTFVLIPYDVLQGDEEILEDLKEVYYEQCLPSGQGLSLPVFTM